VGNIKHRTIIVHTSAWHGEKPVADRVKDFADAYKHEGLLSFNPRDCILVTLEMINGVVTIVLAPSGSKCGWEDDRQWLVICGHFIRWCRETLSWADMVCVDDLGDDRFDDGTPRHSLAEASLFAGEELTPAFPVEQS
jgi:hypothetical protein